MERRFKDSLIVAL